MRVEAMESSNRVMKQELAILDVFGLKLTASYIYLF